MDGGGGGEWGVPMSHVDYKKTLCHPVHYKKTSCHPVDFKKTSCRPVDFKKTSCHMSLKPVSHVATILSNSVQFWTLNSF